MKPEKPPPLIGGGFFCVYGRRLCLGSAVALVRLAVGGVVVDPNSSSGWHHYPPARVFECAHTGTVYPYKDRCNLATKSGRISMHLPTFCPHFRHPPRPRDPLTPHQIRGKWRALHPCGVRDENHDFFSGSGSSYVIGKAEATEDDDWDF